MMNKSAVCNYGLIYSYFCPMKIFQDPGFIIRTLTAIGYVILGIVLALHPTIISFLSKEMTLIFSAVLVIYGLFRGYRAWQLYKEKNTYE